jgi:His/Glu/Gln/Arg/opine family amino acid ABC transporter permease subunit
MMHFGEVLRYSDMLLRGVLFTLELSILTIFLSLILGTIIAIYRISNNKFLFALAAAYVEFFRNVPLLIVIYIIFYANVGLLSSFKFTPFAAGVIALTLNSAAFVAETIRGGLKTIAKEQLESAQSLGLSKFQMFRFVIIPYVMRIVWTALGNQAVDIVLGSSVVSVIAYPELTYIGMNIGATKDRYFEVFIILLFIYLLLSVGISSTLRVIKRVFLKPSELE